MGEVVTFTVLWEWKTDVTELSRPEKRSSSSLGSEDTEGRVHCRPGCALAPGYCVGTSREAADTNICGLLIFLMARHWNKDRHIDQQKRTEPRNRPSTNLFSTRCQFTGEVQPSNGGIGMPGAHPATSKSTELETFLTTDRHDPSNWCPE